MSILYLYMGHYIRVGCIKLHYMGILIFKNSQFWHVLIKIRETWVKLFYSRRSEFDCV